MELHHRRAIENIVRFGDTDIFPFPPENHLFYDKVDEVVDLLKQIDADVPQNLAQYPPENVGALAPVGYTGFRWATQIDAVWNAAYLSWVLSIADKIENARIPKQRNIVFSYRYLWDDEKKTIFDLDYNWRLFIETALNKANTKAFVVSCDISEFYLRINHHRIENAIAHLPDSAHVAPRIRSFLSHLSGTYSFGLPVGGPASRIISELVLSQIDTLLLTNGIDFLRYADDYYLFADSPDESFKAIVTLSRLLIENQGLQLQKSKTRIMSSSEFISSNPLVHDDDEVDVAAPLGEARSAIMSINVHYDPYSPTAAEDYERLKQELDRYPVMEMIRAELKKSRVNITLSRRLISLCRYLDGALLDDAIKTLVENAEMLYPVYYNVLITAKETFERLQPETQDYVTATLRRHITSQSRVMVVDLNLQYAVRLLAMKYSEETKIILAALYRSERNAAIKRDIIVALARWREWHWLSDLRHRFRGMSDLERRAFIMASFGLEDEGEHWRRHVRRELSPLEKLAQTWAGEKQNSPNWQLPL